MCELRGNEGTYKACKVPDGRAKNKSGMSNPALTRLDDCCKGVSALSFSFFIQPDDFKRGIFSQQSQRCFQDPSLLGRIVGAAKRGPSGHLGEGGSRRSGRARSTGVPTGQGCGDTIHFQSASNQSNGLGADWSGGYQQGCIYFFRFSHLDNGRDGFIDDPAYIGLVAAKADDR